MVAPVQAARIEALHAERGARVALGDPLASMERRDAEIILAQADAALAQAESELANLQQGKRPEEIEVIEASLASAKARAAEADRTAQRMISLADRGAATRAERDDAETAAEIAHAQVREIEANLAVAAFPAANGRLRQCRPRSNRPGPCANRRNGIWISVRFLPLRPG